MNALRCENCGKDADATAVMGGARAVHVCLPCLRWASQALDSIGLEHPVRFCENCARMTSLSIVFGPAAVRVCVDCVRTTYAVLAEALTESDREDGGV